MHPFITLTHRIHLDSWWFMMTLALVAGGLTALFLLRREMGWVRAVLLVLVLAWGALFGAHLGHYVFHPWLFRKDPLGVFIFWRDGQTFLGALAFCLGLLALLSACFRRVRFWPALDAFALSIPVGLFFARLGCYLKGCCWGTPISETHPMHGVCWKLMNNRLTALHPVQLYEAAAALGILAALLLIRKRIKASGGVLAAAFLLLYGAARFVLEFFRGDTGGRSLLGFLTVHQEICLLIVPVALILLFLRLGQGRSPAKVSSFAPPEAPFGPDSAGRPVPTPPTLPR